MKKLILLVAMIAITAVSFSQVFKNRATITGVDICMGGIDYVGTVYIGDIKILINAVGKESSVTYTIYNTNRARINGNGIATEVFTFPSLGWIRSDNEAVIIAKLAQRFNVLPSAVNLTQYP
jgi:hypothetical protein